MNIGTDQDLLISNALPSALSGVDSFAKVNIMTEANENYEDNVPQIMLSQTTNDQIKVWNGDRLTMTYTSGNRGGYFGISEVTGSYRNRLNLELFGDNNIFYGTVKGTYDNSFIYANSNRLGIANHGLSFIHSDYNVLNSTAASGINFLNSNNNNFKENLFDGVYASVNDISLYNSDENTFNPTVTQTTAGTNAVSELKNFLLIDSNYNFIKGRTKADEINADKLGRTTFINSQSGLYEFNSNNDSMTMIGNKFGYITNSQGGNIIGIGEGLIQNGGNSDKIILGFYNQNSTNPDELLIVGDGRVNETFIKNQTTADPNWYKNASSFRNVISSISDTGSTALTASHYRHNIFTVNQNGYITISDYRVPSNSARYGYKGITAYVDGNTYSIPFEEVYHKINGNDSIDIMQETVDSYTKQIQSNKLDALPVSRYETFDDGTNTASNLKTSAYLNLDAPSGDANLKLSYIEDCTNNSILNITYQPNINATNKRLPATLIWSYYTPVESGVPATKTVASTDIYPYCTKQFLVLKPSYPLDKRQAKPTSGLSLIEQEVQDNITVNYGEPMVVYDYYVVQNPTAISSEFYCGSAESYEDSWITTDVLTEDITITIFDTIEDIEALSADWPFTWDSANSSKAIVPVVL